MVSFGRKYKNFSNNFPTIKIKVVYLQFNKGTGTA